MSDNNPRWHRWPFKGWREDTAVSVMGCVVWLVLIALLMWAQGCYLEHEALPCEDSGVMPMAGTQAVNLLRSRDGGSNPSTPTVMSDSSTVEHVTVNHGDAGSSPALTAKQCAGPIVAGECYANLQDWLESR